MAEFEKDGPFGFVMEALARHYPELANPFGSDCLRGPVREGRGIWSSNANSMVVQ